ncbi:MCRA family protein [Anaerocolumna jejuensis DSM 15929]|uniref:MCRA family protein n=1 Tax=Anaerocolumna jejuensis DSM 15929 TaxID=1121322 RepID=A0A1M7BTD5_9FIRM|nr:oleate hydratase [Anaerocolumna jejuensis]SHL58272.1 MCRA family protein [Anaerocolumna jejuensis DSM 15929]
MKIYDLHYNAIPPKDIEKKAHIIGGGIAGLAAALFLTEDCHILPMCVPYCKWPY